MFSTRLNTLLEKNFKFEPNLTTFSYIKNMSHLRKSLLEWTIINVKCYICTNIHFDSQKKSLDGLRCRHLCKKFLRCNITIILQKQQDYLVLCTYINYFLDNKKNIQALFICTVLETEWQIRRSIIAKKLLISSCSDIRMVNQPF